MREMELWRDKIQLRIRDRIQTSVSGAPETSGQLEVASIVVGVYIWRS
jgi:hypothetical protein